MADGVRVRTVGEPLDARAVAVREKRARHYRRTLFLLGALVGAVLFRTLVAHAEGLAAGCTIGGVEGTVNCGVVSVVAVNGLLLEDGASYLLLEDGASDLCLESGC